MLQRRDVQAAEDALYAAHGVADMFDYEMACADTYMTKCQFDLAIARLGNAKAMRPLDARVWYAEGICWYHLGDFDRQIACQRQAVKLWPMLAKAHLRLAAGHLLKGEFPEALALYERAVNLDPDDAELWAGYGTMLQVWGEDEAAVRAFRRAVSLNTNFPEGEAGLGFALLKNGEWLEGWKRFEARWRLRPYGAAWDYKPPPVWSGSADEIVGKRVLLRCEQGHGDTIQFCRYIPMVRERAAEVWLVGRPSMQRLMSGFGVPYICEGEAWPEHDLMIGLMSLAGVFGTTLENCPSPAVLHVEPRKQAARVGVCWHGGARTEEPLAHADDVRRSIVWDVFEPITRVTPCVSLQEEDLGVSDWQDTANIVAGLDLVITVDTAVAHLAATLGVETWMLARRGGCWRWLEHGSDTVWYPAMKIYRQPVLNEWVPVVEQVVRDLGEWVRC